MLDFVRALEPLVSRVRTDVTALKHDGKMMWTKELLTKRHLLKHVSGGPARGVCPIKAGEATTMVGLLDLDSHKGETPWLKMMAIAEVIYCELERRGMKPLPFRSSGGMGIHIFVLWDQPQDAYSVRQFMFDVLDAGGYKNGAGGLANHQIEVFPKQDNVPIDGYGSQFILPLAGKSEPLDTNLHLIPAGREYALTMDWSISPPVPFIEKKVVERLPQTHDRMSNLLCLTEMLQHIDPDCGYDNWIRVGMSIHAETEASDEGLDLWDEWSSGSLRIQGARASASYEGRDDLEPHWNSFKSGKEKKAGLGTIKHLAYQDGWREITCNDADFEDLTKNDNNSSDRFRVIPAAEFAKGESPQWYIKGLLPKAGLAMIYGESGAGKSFFVLDIICAIARGIDWCGHKVQQAEVVYIAAEGVGGVRNRLNAYANHYGISLDDLPVGIIRNAPDLRSDDYKLLVQRIIDDGGANIIVVDTLAQASPGANENASEDMGKVINRCKLLHEMTGALVLLIHHSGKDSTRGARGWSGIKGALDAEIEVIQDKNGRKARVTKQKDGESGKEFHFTLHSIVLGSDEDGDPVTSCVVEHQDDPVFVDCSRPNGKWQRLVYNAAFKLIGVSETSVSLEDVISNAIKGETYDAGPDPKEPKRDRRRDEAKRAIKQLHDNGVIVHEGDSISFPQSHETPQSGSCGVVA